MSAPDVMRLLLNASAALDNVRYFIQHRDTFKDPARSAQLHMWTARMALKDLAPLIGDDDDGAAMIAAELALCHAPTDPADDRKLCRLEQGHDGEHIDSFQMYERERRARWRAGTVYDFERADAEAFLAPDAS